MGAESTIVRAIRAGIDDDRQHGRGIAVMTALMDGVELKHDDGGTVVRLAKRRQPTDMLGREVSLEARPA
jgi:anti-sigma regulatory factor (Ser/Thr protein kinase)